MKAIMTIVILMSSLSFAESKKSEKIIELETHPIRILLTGANEYEIELYGHSARYYATDLMLVCLKKSMNSKKDALLKVSAYSLNIKECSIK
ncbi:MAG: hypothetical protein KBD76_05860 [Bacteriovorax sp.]|jgi:hypothetical protein|nr:hypothetical protein [Bacteriovorax sp.]